MVFKKGVVRSSSSGWITVVDRGVNVAGSDDDEVDTDLDFCSCVGERISWDEGMVGKDWADVQAGIKMRNKPAINKIMAITIHLFLILIVISPVSEEVVWQLG